MGSTDSSLIAKVLASVKTHVHFEDRKIGYIQLARLYRSNIEVRRALDSVLSPSMIKRITSLLDLPPEVQRLVEEKHLGVDQAYRISLLDNQSEMRELAKGIFNYNLTTMEVRYIRMLKKRNPSMPIKDCIENRFKQRKVVETTEVIVTNMKPSTYTASLKKAVVEGTTLEKVITSALRESVDSPTSIKSVKVEGNRVSIVLDENGSKVIRKLASKEHVPLEGLLEKVMQSWLNT